MPSGSSTIRTWWAATGARWRPYCWSERPVKYRASEHSLIMVAQRMLGAATGVRMSTPLTEHEIEVTPPPGESLPKIAGYRLTRVIGHGGMSTVYLAEQTSLDREVAIKVMLPEALADEVSRRRFEN